MTTYTDVGYTPWVVDKGGITGILITPTLSGFTATVHWGEDSPDDGLEFFKLTYHFPTLDHLTLWLTASVNG